METYFFYILGVFVIIFIIYRHHNERKDKIRWDSLSEKQKDKELYDSIDEKSKQGLRDVLVQSEKTHTTEKKMQELMGDNILLNPAVVKLKEMFKSLKYLDAEDELEFNKYILFGGGSQKIIEMMENLDDMQKIADVYNDYIKFKSNSKINKNGI